MFVRRGGKKPNRGFVGFGGKTKGSKKGMKKKHRVPSKKPARSGNSCKTGSYDREEGDRKGRVKNTKEGLRTVPS